MSWWGLRSESLLQLGTEFNEDEGSSKHEEGGEPVLRCEGVVEVEDGEEEGHELAQRHHQRHRQRRTLRRQHEHRLDAHEPEHVKERQ